MDIGPSVDKGHFSISVRCEAKATTVTSSISFYDTLTILIEREIPTVRSSDLVSCAIRIPRSEHIEALLPAPSVFRCTSILATATYIVLGPFGASPSYKRFTGLIKSIRSSGGKKSKRR
jgi:hypothetical protein